jgi:hypothetical protein
VQFRDGDPAIPVQVRVAGPQTLHYGASEERGLPLGSSHRRLHVAGGNDNEILAGEILDVERLDCSHIGAERLAEGAIEDQHDMLRVAAAQLLLEVIRRYGSCYRIPSRCVGRREVKAAVLVRQAVAGDVQQE